MDNYRANRMMKKHVILTLLIGLFLYTGCADIEPSTEISCNKRADIITSSVTQTQPIKPTVLNDLKGLKLDLEKYSPLGMFLLYLVLLISACLYFKHTGKRMHSVEASLTTIAPRLNPIAKVLSILAKVIGVIYCKKKK